MLCKLLLITLLCGMAVAIVEVDFDVILAQYKQSLKALLKTSNQRYSQQGQEECFDWYFVQLDLNMNTYRYNTAQCITEYENDIKWQNDDGNKTRQDFENRTHSACNNFYWCEEKSDLLEFYYCYSKASTDSTSLIYKLSADSTTEYNSLLTRYNNAESNKKGCDKDARDRYMQLSENVDKQFDNCRAGTPLPTTPAQSTTSAN